MKRLAFFSVFTLCAVFAACGDDEEDSQADPTSTGTGASGSGGSGSGGEPGSGGAGGSMGTGGLPPGDWACVGMVEWPTATKPNVSVTFNAQLLQSGEPIEGVLVNACAKDDPMCDSPVDTGTTDARGNVTLSLPTGDLGFDGFLDMSGPDMPPALVFINPPVTEDVEFFGITLLNNTTLELFSSLAEVTLDPARGNLALIGLDCALDEAQGLQISASSADADTTDVYLVGMIPTDAATETDPSGAMGILNVPPGESTVTAKLAAQGDTTATIDVLVRAGTITYAAVPPTP